MACIAGHTFACGANKQRSSPFNVNEGIVCAQAFVFVFLGFPYVHGDAGYSEGLERGRLH